MISFEHSTFIIMSLYAFATGIGVVGMLARKHTIRLVAAGFTVAGFAMQTFDMMRGIHGFLPGGLSWGAYLQILAWFMVLCGIGASVKWRSPTPTLFLTPLALMLFLMSWRFLRVEIALPQTLGGAFYALHIGALYLSLALMALAFAAGVVFIFVEKRIKAKEPLAGFQKDFPALAILDKINAVTVLLGFPLFTIGILAGFTWASSTWGFVMSGDPKEVVSLVVWALFAWLFHMRTIQGLRGRKPALVALWLFGLSVFSILVVNAFFETHHNFT